MKHEQSSAAGDGAAGAPHEAHAVPGTASVEAGDRAALTNSRRCSQSSEPNKRAPTPSRNARNYDTKKLAALVAGDNNEGKPLDGAVNGLASGLSADLAVKVAKDIAAVDRATEPHAAERCCDTPPGSVCREMEVWEYRTQPESRARTGTQMTKPAPLVRDGELRAMGVSRMNPVAWICQPLPKIWGGG
jgi:hypothetical protein